MTHGTSEWARAPATSFCHGALFYRSIPEQLDAIREFVSEGLKVGDGILVMLSEPKIDALRTALGSAAEKVSFIATNATVDNPARSIPEWRRFVNSLGAGQSRRGVSEPLLSDMTATMVSESQIHESLLNLAFEDEPSFWLLCTYDDGLNAEVLDQARRSHRYVWSASGRTSLNERYEKSQGSEHLESDLAWEAPGDAQRLDVNVQSIGIARQALYEFAHAFGMTESASADYALAGHEVISNSLRHGGGEAQLSIWRDAETLICQVTDGGRFEQPLAGRDRPGETGRTGRGLWIANQLCDLVQIRSLRRGTLVRLHMHRRSRVSA